MFRFETPLALLALLAPLAYGAIQYFLHRRASKNRVPQAYPVAMAALYRPLPKSWRVRFAILPNVLLTITWVLLSIALARPQSGQEQHTEITQGIAIEMILDRSGSMRNPMNYFNKRMNRLETVKSVFSQFVFGDKSKGLSGRHSDLIGVIGFSHYPYTFCPLTLDHDALAFSLKNIELITEDSDENGTAIGDAVALGIARLMDAERTLSQQTRHDASTYRIKNKVIILLTDGQDEGPHTRSIKEAAILAKENGIKVYTIAIIGEAAKQGNQFGPFVFNVPQQYDTTDIKEMAAITGGQFNTCDDAKALLEIYKKINELEKSSVESLRYVIHHELYFPFAAAALICLITAILLKNTILRRIP